MDLMSVPSNMNQRRFESRRGLTFPTSTPKRLPVHRPGVRRRRPGQAAAPSSNIRAIHRPHPPSVIQNYYDREFESTFNSPFPSPTKPPPLRGNFDPPNLYSQGFPGKPSGFYKTNRHQTIPDHAVFISPPPSIAKTTKTPNIRRVSDKINFRAPVGSSNGKKSRFDYYDEDIDDYDDENLFDTHNRMQPILLKDEDNGRRRVGSNPRRDGPTFRPSAPIDPNDYRFYSFVTKPTTSTTRRPYYTTKGPNYYTTKRSNYYTTPAPRPQRPPAVAPNNLDLNEYHRPKYDAYDDYSQYEDDFSGYNDDQGIELPESDDGGFKDDDRRPPPEFPNTFTFYNQDLHSYSVYDRTTPRYDRTTRATRTTTPRPWTPTRRPDVPQSDSPRRIGHDGQKPFTIGLDVYPVVDYLEHQYGGGSSGGNSRFGSEENRHEVLLKLNLFSKKPNIRGGGERLGDGGRLTNKDSGIQFGPFSYNTNG